MKTQQTKCSVCTATLQKKRITYTQQVGDNIYQVTDVPAEVCPQCAEEYLSPDTVDALERITKTRKAERTLHVPVYHFPHSA
jgi:YgiT-type zinc finger domain-containing protein